VKIDWSTRKMWPYPAKKISMYRREKKLGYLVFGSEMEWSLKGLADSSRVNLPTETRTGRTLNKNWSTNPETDGRIPLTGRIRTTER